MKYDNDVYKYKDDYEKCLREQGYSESFITAILRLKESNEKVVKSWNELQEHAAKNPLFPREKTNEWTKDEIENIVRNSRMIFGFEKFIVYSCWALVILGIASVLF